MANISREKLLSMPHWEVLAILHSVNRYMAQYELSISEAVALGSGTLSDEFQREKILNSLKKRSSGITAEEEEEIRRRSTKSWTTELQDMMRNKK